MTTETPIQKQELLTVNGCRIAKNQKSWELKARATFQDRDSNWWIPKRGESHIENGRYLCLIERGNKWATDSQGDGDWQYNWKIIQFNVEQEEPTEEAKFDEKIETSGGVFYIDGASVLYLVGSVMDWVEDDFSAGFVFENPNAKGACGCGESFMV